VPSILTAPSRISLISKNGPVRLRHLLRVSSSRELPMSPFAVWKRRTQPRVRMDLEELEGRALLSSVQLLPVGDTAYSLNWSGYAAETNLSAPASNAVTQVSGSWNVPTVTGRTNAYSSVWVGIDGYSSSSVEQLGTEQDTSKS